MTPTQVLSFEYIAKFLILYSFFYRTSLGDYFCTFLGQFVKFFWLVFFDNTSLFTLQFAIILFFQIIEVSFQFISNLIAFRSTLWNQEFWEICVIKEYLRMQSASSRSDYLIRISCAEFCFLQTIKFWLVIERFIVRGVKKMRP